MIAECRLPTWIPCSWSIVLAIAFVGMVVAALWPRKKGE